MLFRSPPQSRKPLKDRFLFWQTNRQKSGQVIRGTEFLSSMHLNVANRQSLASYEDFDDLFRGNFFEELPDFIKDRNFYAPAILLEVAGHEYMPCVRLAKSGPAVQYHNINKFWGPKDFALLLK